jgi:hypothetical protein
MARLYLSYDAELTYVYRSACNVQPCLSILHAVRLIVPQLTACHVLYDVQAMQAVRVLMSCSVQ